MQQNRALFFGIIGLAILLVIGIFIVQAFIPAFGSAPVSIQVVVAPSIRPWIQEATQTFNETQSDVLVEIIAANELIPSDRFRSNDPTATLPAAWVAEASFVVDMAREDGLLFDDSQSIASTSLAWGGYNDKLTQFEQSYGSLNWTTLNAKATNPDDLLKLVLASPQNRAEGLAALISATAAQGGSSSIASNDVPAAFNWLDATLGDRRVYLPSTPAQSFASAQGRTLGDFGLLSMASWREAGLDQNNAQFTLITLEPVVTLDVPFAIFTDSSISAEQQQAAQTFRTFLLANAQQQQLDAYFFDTATANVDGISIDGAGAERLLDWASRSLQ